MVVSNELQVTGLIHTAKMMFELAAEVQELLGIDIEFLDFGGGIGSRIVRKNRSSITMN